MRTLKAAALVFGIWIVFIPQVLGQPGQRVAPKKQPASGHLAQHPDNSEQSASSAELKAIADAITKYEQEAAKSQNQETPEEKESIKIQWFLLWIGIAQTVALIGTLGAIVWQSRETARSAKATQEAAEATKKSVELQRAAMRQWLKVGDWSVDTPFPNKNFIRLSCDIANPTNMLLTIRNVEFSSSHWSIPPYGPHWTLPHGENGGFQLPGIQLAGKLLEDFEKGVLEFNTTLEIGFDDAFGKRETQSFSRTCVCGRNRPSLTTQQWAKWPGTRNTEQQEKNPT